VGSGRKRLFALCCAALLAGCGQDEGSAPPAPPLVLGSQSFDADLAQLAGKRVLFVHGALGAQVLAALGKLAGSRVAVRAIPLGADDPNAALDSFEQALAAGPAPDLALVELPLAGVRGDTSGKALFTRYRKSLARLRAAHPETAFVPVTLPLVARETGLRGLARQLTGASRARSRANTARDDFDGRVREAYRDQPIFDIAALGSVGGEPPGLSPVAQDRAAHALVDALARALRTRAGGA
jgi:hypothetical protein